MERDVQRIARIREALRAKRVDAVVCTLPMNVLMVSGYWPFVGTTIAIATADGKIGIVVPQDAARVAVEGWADELETFRSGSLNELKALEDCVRGPLSQMVRRLGLSAACIVAYEDTADVEPASYAGMNVYGAALPALLSSAIPGICLASGGEMLAGIRAVLTESELKRLRIACEIVGCSFEAGHAALRSGLTETQVADAFRMGLSAPCLDGDAPGRADGFVYCMSGPNSPSRMPRINGRRLGRCDRAILSWCTAILMSMVCGPILRGRFASENRMSENVKCTRRFWKRAVQLGGWCDPECARRKSMQPQGMS